MTKALHRPVFAQFSLLVFTLCVLCGKTAAQDFKQVHPGVEYAQVEHKLGSDPVKINLLRLDLKKVRLDVHHALDKAIGLETTSSIATRKGAIAAINAGFFRLDKSEWAGDSAGTLMIDGKLLSESFTDRSSVFITNLKQFTEVSFQRIRTKLFIGNCPLQYPTYDQCPSVPILGINRARNAGDIIVFDSKFGTNTKTASDGLEIQLTKCNVNLRTFNLNGISCKRSAVSRSNGNSVIPSAGYVISAGAENTDLDKLKSLFTNGKKPLVITPVVEILVDPNEKGSSLITGDLRLLPTYLNDITNGVSRLIKRGEISINWEQEKASKSFAETRHPRTAVAKLKDGKFLMMTVDGRQPGVSVGMSLQELAEYLFSLGAVDAMNLDGGGSTTMFLDGKVVNKPSDPNGERKIGDAIVVTLRNKKK